MKTLKSGIIICMALVAFTSCKKGGVFCYKGDGNIVKEERVHTSFDEISLELAGDVYLKQGADFKVEIEASKNLIEVIETKVKGDVLKIDTKKNKCIKGNSDIKFYITMPEIRGISISGSGDVIAREEMDLDDLDISISGSGDIRIDSLRVNDISTSISGSGDVRLTTLDTANYQYISISGSGEVSAFDAPVKESDIRISGSGGCKVHAIDRLNIKISGSGDVVYKGTPSITQTTSGSGTIRPY